MKRLPGRIRMRIHNNENKVGLFNGVHHQHELIGFTVTGGVIADRPAAGRLS